MWGLLRLSRKKFVEEALTHNKEETFLVPHWNKKTLQIQQKQKRTASTIVAHRFSAVGLHGISISQSSRVVYRCLKQKLIRKLREKKVVALIYKINKRKVC